MLKKIVTLTLMIISSMVMQAQIRDFYFNKVKHYIGTSFEAGYAMNPNSISDANQILAPSGVGGGVSLFYELQYKHLLFQVGVGAEYNLWHQKLTNQSYETSVKEYSTMTLHYDMTSVEERQQYGVAYVPVFVGGIFGGFYFLVGTKIGLLSFHGYGRPSSTINIWATDEDVIDPMCDLYTHNLHTFYVENKQRVNFSPVNIMASAEIGVDFDHWLVMRPQSSRWKYYSRNGKKWVHLRVSLYVDYGLSNLHRYTLNEIPFKNGDVNMRNGGMFAFEDVDCIKIGSWTGFKPYAEQKLNNLSVGIKFTMTSTIFGNMKKACLCEKDYL